jgi:hypothetical protein
MMIGLVNKGKVVEQLKGFQHVLLTNTKSFLARSNSIQRK